MKISIEQMLAGANRRSFVVLTKADWGWRVVGSGLNV